ELVHQSLFYSLLNRDLILAPVRHPARLSTLGHTGRKELIVHLRLNLNQLDFSPTPLGGYQSCHEHRRFRITTRFHSGRDLIPQTQSAFHLGVSISDPCTLYDPRRFVIECPAPSTTIFLAMKNSIIFISVLSLVGMMLASCNSIPSAFDPDETATTHVTSWRTEPPPERSAEDSVNSISGGHY